MAFGITRDELTEWKRRVKNEQIAFLTHYWIDNRFPGCKTVTKVGCGNISTLVEWGKQYGLKEEWIDLKEEYPHFDLFGKYEYDIMKKEGHLEQLKRFK